VAAPISPHFHPSNFKIMKRLLPILFLLLISSATFGQICNVGTNLVPCSGFILGQENSGAIGGFGFTDEWMAIGKAPFPSPATGDFPYGERYQRSNSLMLQQLEVRNGAAVDVFDGVIGIGVVKTGSAVPTLPRLDFEYVYQNQTTLPPSIRKTNIMTITGALSKPFTPTSTIFCLNPTGVNAPCYGRVGIENTNPSYTLDVNGIIRAQTTLYTSDARFKTKVETIANPLDVISKLRGTTYEFRTDVAVPGFDFADGKQSGFIAQELEQVLPHTVFTDESGYKAVNYIAVMPYLVEAVKELRTQNEEVMAQNAALQAQLDALLKGSTKGQEPAGTIGTAMPAELFQNVPNPTSGATEIRYSLPETVRAASLLVFDMNGKQLRSFDIRERGLGNVRIAAGELSAGMYLYTLLADGKEIGTRRMIITE
jgi:hypothetical protein